LHFSSSASKSDYLGIEGLGLGILRNKLYENHVEEKTFTYRAGDILVLFTDGVIEAKNHQGKQFGFERLRSLLEVYNEHNSKEIQTSLIDSLHHFVGGDGKIDDDYSMMVVKFN
jgi:serine phosphatase RsbU (regulator of sigma subunit)